MHTFRRAIWPACQQQAVQVCPGTSAVAARALGTAKSPPPLPKLKDELHQEATGLAQAVSTGRRTVIGIDPDNSGAIAVVRLGSAIQEEGGQGDIMHALSSVEIEVFDMPLEKISVGKRQRSQAFAPEVVSILSSVTAAAADRGELHAVLEQPIPSPVNGLYSVFGTAYAYGLWTGVVAALGVEMQTVSARRWKMDLGLNKQGKEGSRALALALFPTAGQLLRRKKDHGRAEALLIVAWALGIRLPPASETAEKLAAIGPAGNETSSDE